MDPNTAMEAATEGVKAVTKFQEIIAKIFGPKWTRSQTNADMDANERKLQMIRENPDMEISFKGNEMCARRATTEELAARAERRRLIDAVRQERNIENVLETTARELPDAKAISDDPVDDDWITRFLNIVKDVSSAEMQYIWGKILAGEIAAPKSFSLRTLETIRNMSTAEAQVFQKVIPLVVRQGDIYFISAGGEIYTKYGVTYSDVLALGECGLINSSGMLTLDLTVSNGKISCILGTESLIAIKGESEEPEKIRIMVYALTKVGAELYQVLSHSTNEQYMSELARYIFEDSRSKVQTSIHKIVAIIHADEGDSVQCVPKATVIFSNETTT